MTGTPETPLTPDTGDARAEQAFRDAFARHASDLEPVPVSAPGPRRSRWLIPAVAAASVVLASAVGVAVVSSDRNLGPGEEAASPSDAATTADAPVAQQPLESTRTASYHDVEVTVPADWVDAYNPGGDWCANEGGTRLQDSPPYVGITDNSGFQFAIGCGAVLLDMKTGKEVPVKDAAPDGFPDRPMNTWASNLTLTPAYGNAPDIDVRYEGWVSITRTVAGVELSLLADPDDAKYVDAILDSARVVDVDSIGCDTTSPVQAEAVVEPEPVDIDAVDRVTSVAVCAYERPTPRGPGLMGSRLIEGSAAQDLLRAIQVAPLSGKPNDQQTCDEYATMGATTFVLRLNDGAERRGDLHGYIGGCNGSGLHTGLDVRVLTKDDCAPLWGGRVQLPNARSGHAYRFCE